MCECLAAVKLQNGITYICMESFAAVYMSCLGILIGILSQTFTAKCVTVADKKCISVCDEVDTLVEEFKVLKTNFQLGLFISFAFGTVLVTIYTYGTIVFAMLPCFEEYTFLEAQISQFLHITVYGLNLYFYAKSMDECHQAFRGLLDSLRSV